ncbi:hypothetical protein FE257_009219 [Aspergillus nanangensis]|uniref:Major facilitator superfamily (MFS) profile domain-containing protein n=1 Tax=Aspergillus nanangensis TaxID=2582783 RepID=A0AAD4GS93_ASPNN|nr:hypothetical protein FE257_009219 [Aspergillus nanangensis]
MDAIDVMETPDEPRLQRSVTLNLVGDWGMANFHRVCSWLTQEFCDRAGPESRTAIWSIRHGGIEAITAVHRGEAQLAIATPAQLISTALRGEGIFARFGPMPELRSLAVLPQNDRMVLAVSPKHGISSFADLRQKKPALRIATSHNDGTNFIGYIASKFMAAHGICDDVLSSWGASYVTATRPEQAIELVESGQADALLQEAIMTPWWENVIEKHGFVPLPAEPDALQKFQLDNPGVSAADPKPLPEGFWSTLKEPLPALDFSDFVVLVRDDLPDDVAYLLTWCLVERKSAIEQQYRHLRPDRAPLSYPLDPVKMAQSPVPLHDAARRFCMFEPRLDKVDIMAADPVKSEPHPDNEAMAEKNASSAQPNAIAATFDALGGAPDPWGRGHLQLYGACLIIYFCSTMNGYDGSLMGSINVLPEYQSYYDLGSSGSSTTGLVFSIFNIGQMAGALFVWITDLCGRKKTLGVTAFGVCCSAVFTALAPSLPAFIAARFLLSFFSTICCVAAPMLLVEIAPPLHRATVAGIYNTLYYLGSIIATFTMYGANIHLTGNLKWRLPLWLQILCPGFACLGSWLLPESPRWQIAQGKREEARQFIIKHHANGDEHHPIVAIEMQEIEDSLVEVRSRSTWACFDLRSLFKSRARLYRMMLVVAMSWFGQFSGNNVASYYLPLMVQNVGITSTNMVLLLNAIYAVTGWVAATVGARLHDIIGRRKMLTSSCLAMSVALAIVAATTAVYEKSGTFSSSAASIAFIFIFGVVFSVAFTPMQPIYPAEVLANDMRANGMMVFQITAGCASFVNTFAAPITMENIKYWFYVFFVFWDLFEFIVIYLFFVETKGRTLEELDVIFEAQNPRKASTQKIDL